MEVALSLPLVLTIHLIGTRIILLYAPTNVLWRVDAHLSYMDVMVQALVSVERLSGLGFGLSCRHLGARKHPYGLLYLDLSWLVVELVEKVVVLEEEVIVLVLLTFVMLKFVLHVLNQL